MKRIHRILLNLFPIYALLTIGCFSSCRTAHIPEKQETAISGNVLIVFYDAEMGKSDLLSAAKKYGSRIIYSYKNFNGIAITLPSDKGVEESIRYYQRVKGVLSAGEKLGIARNQNAHKLRRRKLSASSFFYTKITVKLSNGVIFHKSLYGLVRSQP